MKKKVLFTATVDSHIKFFHLPYLEYFKQRGYEVHVMTNGRADIPFCDVKHTVPMEKFPLNLSNIKAYKAIKGIIAEEEFDYIHCHMPMAAALTRLAAKSSRKRGTKVIYTAHGFHFYEGGPRKNWMIYYPVEKWCARYTDCLITINQEDYTLTKKANFPAKRLEYVKGVGVNLDKFKPVSKQEQERLKIEMGYKADDFVVMYVAELNDNKNQQLTLHALKQLGERCPHMRLVLIGEGANDKAYKQLALQLGIAEKVDFLGVRQDVNQLLQMADLYVATSLREGLPLNVLEAMATGIPICATKNRGHLELIEDDVNGKLVDAARINELVKVMHDVYMGNCDTSKWIQNGLNRTKDYDLLEIKAVMQNIYKNL